MLFNNDVIFLLMTLLWAMPIYNFCQFSMIKGKLDYKYVNRCQIEGL
jgi:hypothetical protein